jgi:hypothetical protein
MNASDRGQWLVCQRGPGTSRGAHAPIVAEPLHLIGIWFAGVAASNGPLLLARVEFHTPGRMWDPSR